MRIVDMAVQTGCRLAHGRRNPSPPFMSEPPCWPWRRGASPRADSAVQSFERVTLAHGINREGPAGSQDGAAKS